MTTPPSTRVLGFDDTDNVVDVNDALFLEPYISGSHTYARSVYLSRVHPDATLLPPGVSASRVAVFDTTRSVLAFGPGWALCAVRWLDGHARVSVTATSDELSRAIVAEATGGASRQTPLRDTVPIGFWHLGSNQPVRSERSVRFEQWTRIRRNYPSRAAFALDALMALRQPVHGKLLLLHGPPGTGKTTVLRTLADRWRSWCRFDFVLDPERMFAEPSYLMSVALRDHDPTGDEDTAQALDVTVPAAGGPGVERTARMLVLEDCDELITAGAKERAGQGLSRLLNLTDGLLGQGLSLLVAITTNEPIGRLHPAVVRPGRCIAHIEIGRLSRREAAEWLGRDPGSAEGFTLAELVAQDGTQAAPRPSVARTGQYL